MKKNIVFILPSLTSGGAERVVTTLANELVYDFNVKIVQLYKSQPFYKLHKDIKLEHCKEVFNPNLTVFKSITNHFFLISRIYNFLKKDSDIVIGFTTTSNIYTTIVSRFLKTPCIISERNNPKYSISNKYWQYLRKIIYPKADKIIIQTEAIREYYLDYISLNKLKIISNPLAPELTKHKVLIENKENIIINVGRLDNQKNQRLLIKAFSNIPHDNWQLHIIGEGQLRTEFNNLITELNEQDSIHLLGRNNSIHEVYKIAKIFALTSNYEGFPNALIEAMHFGLPCISTDCPTGPSELIDNNINGFLIAMNDQEDLENKLLDLMNNQKIRDKFGENAKKTSSVFDSEIIATEWRNLINDLLT